MHRDRWQNNMHNTEAVAQPKWFKQINGKIYNECKVHGGAGEEASGQP